MLDPRLIDLLSGGVGGALTILVGHPFDRVKTYMQLNRGPLRPRIVPALASVWSSGGGGVRGLYAGASTLLAGVVPVYALCFWGYAVAGDALRGRPGGGGAAPPQPLPLPQVALAGALSAVPTTLIAAPGERLKVLVMSGRFGGPLEAARTVLRAGGLRALYRGGGATLARDALGSAAYFSTYETGVRASQGRGAWDGRARAGAGSAGAADTGAAAAGWGLWPGAPAPPAPPPPPPPPSALTAILSGAAAGAAHWTISLPIDVVKSRVQADASGALRARDAAAQLWAEGGARAFFRGLGPALLRALPANAACFWGVEQTRALLSGGQAAARE
jgi:solute carrier family 25 carnitine/acylcarnitine transporter 20/29